LSVGGNTTIGGTLTVAGATTTNGLTNNGVFTQNGNIVQTSGTATLLNTTINGTLAVSGLSTLTGVTNNGVLTQNGNINQTSGTSTLLNTQVNGTLGSTGNTNLATNGGTSNSFGSGAGSNNTIGNPGTSTNTITGVNNTMTATGGANTINGTTNVNGNVQINGTLGSTGNLTLGTASVSNVYGGPTSANRFNGISNFGTIPATNGNKLIVDGAANLNLPAGPSGVPPGFVVPTDFEAIVNGDFEVTGWSSLHNATVDNLWVTGTLMAPAAIVCFNTLQVQNLDAWCSAPGTPINLLTNMVGGGIRNITGLNNLQASTVTIGTALNNQTTLHSTNATGAAIDQNLAQVGGQIPVLLRQMLQLTGAGGGPNGGAITPNFTFGANGFDGNDAITVTYYTRNGVNFGSIYPVAVNAVAGTLQVESTNPLDNNTVIVTILRD
jgi:hypothetical protein